MSLYYNLSSATDISPMSAYQAWQTTKLSKITTYDVSHDLVRFLKTSRCPCLANLHKWGLAMTTAWEHGRQWTTQTSPIGTETNFRQQDSNCIFRSEANV